MVGMVLGSALVARLKAARIIVGGIMLISLFVALFGASKVIWIALVSLFFVGLSLTPVQTAASTML